MKKGAEESRAAGRIHDPAAGNPPPAGGVCYAPAFAFGSVPFDDSIVPAGRRTEGDPAMHRNPRAPLVLVAVLAGLGLMSVRVGAALTTERVASGLRWPIYATAPVGDNRLFIIDQRGVIRILENGSVLATPFLDIDALVPDFDGYDERGLLGLAFPSNYALTGYFFINYINLSSDTVIARYRVSSDPDVANPETAEIVLTIDQPDVNHNGGTLLFGPDGYLYIGMGDGGGAGDPGDRAQSDGSLLGKMLRIDVNHGLPYTIPPDNPFAGPGLPLDEIWDKGFRNPYRWTFDRQTGDLYIADVGQNAWEEIDFEPAGSGGGINYGWRLMEGNHCYNPPQDCDDGTLTHPIYEYSHGGNPNRCSVTGGSIYRGDAIPSLRGTYFFADYCSNQIWSFRYVNGVVMEFRDRTDELAPGGGMSIASIAAIGEDGHGEIYIVDRGSGGSGEIFKIIASPSDAPDCASVPGATLSAPYPDPFTHATRLDIGMDSASSVEIAVFDPRGRLIRNLVRDVWPAGRHAVEWDGKNDGGLEVASGVYFIRSLLGGRPVAQRIHFLR